MRLPGGHDHAAHVERRDPPRPQRLDQLAGRRFGEGLLGAIVGAVEHGAVLDHHPVEQIDAGKDVQQIRELAPGHQDELPPGRPEPLERGQRGVVHPAGGGDGTIVITGQGVIAHYAPAAGPARPTDPRW